MSSQIIKKSSLRGLKLERLEARDVPAVMANPDSFTTTEDQPFPIADDNGNLPSVLSNDDNDGAGNANLIARLVRQPEKGELTLNEDGTFFYTPEADHFGTVSFDYEAVDASNDTLRSQATVTINIEAVDDTPYAFELNVEVGPNGGLIPLEAIDAEAGELIFEIAEQPEFGTLEETEDGWFYTPNPGTVGDTFKFTATDLGGNTSAPASVWISVTTTSGNTAPVAVNDSYSTNEDTVLLVPAPGVLGNDFDSEGGVLTASVVTQPQHGSLTLASDGSFSYTPNANYHGADSFTYRVTDSEGAAATATVNLEIRLENDAPNSLNQSVTASEDTPFAGVLHGTDVEGDTLSFAKVGDPAHGTVVVFANGSFTYTPNANFNGTDSFTFKVNDGTVDGNVATVTVTVVGVNDAPSLAPATFWIAENSPNGTSVGTVGGSDPEGDALSYSITAGNGSGAFAIDPVTGAIRVANAAALDFETTPVFTLTVRATDTGGLFAQSTITIRLTDVLEARTVGIDIDPSSRRNRINLRGDGEVQVAILSTQGFNARQVDVNSLRFGRTGTEDSISRNRRGQAITEVRDVNRDGRPDLVVTFEIEDTGFQVGDTVGYLNGKHNNGTAFTASDSVIVRRGRR